LSVIAIFSIPDGYCLLYQFQLLNWGLFGNYSACGQLFGDNCFVFVFGLDWFGLVWVWLGCLTAAKKASADFRGKEKVGDGSPGL